jgi:hypothetical protein
LGKLPSVNEILQRYTKILEIKVIENLIILSGTPSAPAEFLFSMEWAIWIISFSVTGKR